MTYAQKSTNKSLQNNRSKMASKTYFASIEMNRLKKDGKIDEQSPKICFKRDGQRFDEEFTLKLPIETKFEFQVQIRPPMPVRSVSIKSSESDESGMKIVDHSSPENGAMYSFQWETDSCQADKKRKRSMDNMKLELPLQVKFYKLEDAEHLAWGTPLKHINFEWEQTDGSLNIMKKCFL